MDLIKIWTQVLILLLVPLLLVLSAYLTIAFFEVAAHVPLYNNILVIGERTTTLAVGEQEPTGKDAVASVASALDVATETEPPLPTPPPEAAPGAVLEEMQKSEMEELLALHNGVRGDLGIPPLVWSPALARSAEDFADTLAQESCSLRHSYSEYGENIYYSRKYGSDQTPRTPAEVMREFIRESEYYDHDTHTCESGKICGHYTQIVWSDTTAVGCAKSACVTDEREEVWVCHYDPAGNVEGAPPF